MRHCPAGACCAIGARTDDGPLRATALWFVGEYADDVVAGRGASDDDVSPPPSAAAVAAVLAGYADPASPAGAVAPPADRAAALTALAKLAARAPADAAAVALSTAASRSTSRDVEEQTRAVEYGALLSADRAPLAAAVLDRVPALDPAAHAAAADALPAPPGADAAAADLVGDLLALDVGGGGGGGGGGSSAAPPAVDPLADLLGGAAPAAALAPATPTDAAGRSALPEDLFADPTPAAPRGVRADHCRAPAHIRLLPHPPRRHRPHRARRHRQPGLLQARPRPGRHSRDRDTGGGRAYSRRQRPSRCPQVLQAAPWTRHPETRRGRPCRPSLKRCTSPTRRTA